MVKVGIVGASSHTSNDLLRFLVNHPGDLEIELVTSETYTGQRVDRVLPNLRGFIESEFEALEIDALKDRVDVMVLAVPHKIAMSYVPPILEQAIRVIDYSADYRLKAVETYEAWYHVEHTNPERISGAIYGLPECYRELIRTAELVANPGCYPTGAILAAMPLLNRDLVERDSIIIDSKSGLSGAGSKPNEKTHFPIRDANFTAYNIGIHRHTPEIEQELSNIAGETIRVTFTPHLVPMTRGILSTLYCELKASIPTKTLLDIYAKFYEKEPFVRVLDKGEYPETKAVTGSNYCDVGLEVDTRTNRVIVMSAIDNLGKGASGAVVQNLNLMFGFEETAGLRIPGMMP
jgi:N-acetyl-gamma-glutamyl-phosphate reductase